MAFGLKIQGHDKAKRDSEFIASARGDVPALLAEVERLTAEVEMLRGVGCMEDGDGPCGVCRKCAFKRGVAAMREAAASHFSVVAPYDYIAPRIRSLPDPEDTK